MWLINTSRKTLPKNEKKGLYDDGFLLCRLMDERQAAAEAVVAFKRERVRAS